MADPTVRMGYCKGPGEPEEARRLFEEAQSVFLDDNALLIDDPDHSVHEARFLLLGISSHLRALVVCHCCRDRGNALRIISARKADRSERALYSKGLRR